ncbi:hypothetical protein [Methylobacterium oryzisoli]|uniref:hypothetical protein n=1 Tax=Methylobacterium oryzisoli TaxID=3385502 RepID=UPI0038913FD8
MRPALLIAAATMLVSSAASAQMQTPVQTTAALPAPMAHSPGPRADGDDAYGHPYDIPADPYGLEPLRKKAKAAHSSLPAAPKHSAASK